jgi:hypothetical protein
MEYRKEGLALIEQGISDTLCSLDLISKVPFHLNDQVKTRGAKA